MSNVLTRTQNLGNKVDQIADLIHDMSKANLALVSKDTEPPPDESEDCELNMCVSPRSMKNQ